MNEWTAPSRKWMVTQVTALAALATAFLQAGAWDTTLSVMAVGIITQAIIAYLVPNATGEPPPAPAPKTGLRSERGQVEPLNLLVYVIVIVILIVVLFAVIDRL